MDALKIENNISNENLIEEKQRNFLQTNLGKAVNMGCMFAQNYSGIKSKKIEKKKRQFIWMKYGD